MMQRANMTVFPAFRPKPRSTKRRALWCRALSSGLVAVLFLPGPILAQPAPPVGSTTPTASIPATGNNASAGGVLDDVIGAIQQSFTDVGDRLGDIAWTALLTLLVVDFVLRAGRAVMGNAPIADLIKGFAFQLGFVSLVYGFIAIVPEFVDFLARTAIRIAGEAGSPGVSASDLVGDGLARAVSWLTEISIWSPGSVFFVVAAAISVIVLAVTVAMLVVIWAELYLCALAGLIVLMFAGLSETRDIAVGYINSLVGKSLKLMGLLIIVAATGEMTGAMARMDGAGFAAAMGMILMQIVSAVLILTLPGALEGLVGGKFASKSAEMIGGMARTAATVGGAAAGGAAAGAAAGAVSKGVAAAGGGGSVGNIAKDAAKGLATGARDGGIGTGGMVARHETMQRAGQKIAERLGYGGRE